MPTIFENERKLNAMTGVPENHIEQAKRIIYNLHIQPDIVQLGSLLKFEFTFPNGIMMDAYFYDYGIECMWMPSEMINVRPYIPPCLVTTDAEFIKLFLDISRKQALYFSI